MEEGKVEEPKAVDDEDEDEEEEESKDSKKTTGKPIVVSLTAKREDLAKKIAAAVAASPKLKETPTPQKRKRATKAEMEQRAKEKNTEASKAEDSTPKRRGRKPMDPETKEKLRKERLKVKHFYLFKDNLNLPKIFLIIYFKRSFSNSHTLSEITHLRKGTQKKSLRNSCNTIVLS